MAGRRVQVLLDDERYAALAALAERRHTSVAAVIRELLDRELRASHRRRAAANRLLAAEPMPVGDPAALITELNILRGDVPTEGGDL